MKLSDMIGCRVRVSARQSPDPWPYEGRHAWGKAWYVSAHPDAMPVAIEGTLERFDARGGCLELYFAGRAEPFWLTDASPFVVTAC